MAYKTLVTGQNFQNTTDAAFRAWCQFISDSLAAAGWVQTADTGQINLTTVLAPTAASQNRGYQIWRMADALQATAPVYKKIEYATSVAGNVPGVQVSFGTGSNGSGTLTTIIFPALFIHGGNNASAKYAFSGDTNRFTMALNYGTTVSEHLFFGVERTKADDGTDNSTGILVSVIAAFVAGTNTSSGRFAYCPFTGTLPPIEITGNCLIPSSGTTVFGTDVAVFPPTYFGFGAAINTGLNWFGYRNDEILDASIIGITPYSAAIDYLCLGTSAQTQALTLFKVSQNNNRPMMRY